MKEILFSHNNTRCHATIVKEKPDFITDKFYIGQLKGYSIYATDIIFNQFGFIAIKENEKESTK